MTGIINEMCRVVAEVIGDDKQANEVVHALIKNFNGERLYMPVNDHEKRNLEMRSLHRAGASAEALAKRYRLRPETIYRIIKA